MPTRLGPTLPPIAQSDFVQEADHALAGRVPTPTHPFRFASLSDRKLARAAPMLGEHNEEILGAVLGLSEAEIRKLEEKKVIGRRPIGL